MKLNKSLLAAIAMGVSVGITTTSCRPLEVTPADVELHEHSPDCNDECTTGNTTEDPNPDPVWDCPACGMG